MPLLPFYTIKQSILNIAIAVLIPAITFLTAKMISHDILYFSGQPQATIHAQTPEEQEKAAQTQKHQDYAIFYISAVFGLASIVFGVLTKLSSLNTGFIIGGFTCLGLGYFIHGLHMSDLLKLALLIIAFIIILFISYRYRTVYVS